jgi:hypothetical protein
MIGNAELAPETGIVRDVNARLLSTLRISGRRVVEMAPGAWAVLGRPDRRTRRMMSVDGATVARLLAERKLCLTTDGACVLADGVIAPPPPSLSANAFIAAGRTRRKGDAGKGFLGLAVLARRGQGPLNLRQVKAGLRLIADAELDSNSRGLTMNWDAGPADAQRRGPRRGGQSASAASAAAKLKRVRGLAGEASWRLAWLACIEGATLKSIKTQTGLGQRTLGPALARALEDIANAYER